MDNAEPHPTDSFEEQGADGPFQHLRLERDLDLVLVDAGDPWGGGRMPPRGRLREPMAGLARAHAVLVTKLPAGPSAVVEEIRRVHATGRPILVGTISVQESEEIAGQLRECGVDCAVLNARRVERDYAAASHCLAKGEEWGRFEFGSTIVLLASRGLVDLACEPSGTPLRLGRRIDALLGPVRQGGEAAFHQVLEAHGLALGLAAADG